MQIKLYTIHPQRKKTVNKLSRDSGFLTQRRNRPTTKTQVGEPNIGPNYLLSGPPANRNK